MAETTTPSAPLPAYPVASNGKRNWSVAAVRGGEPIPTHQTLPESQLALGDFIDLINPLQHIPIIGHAYRALTGDTIAAPARIFGGLLFGGPVGLLASIGGTVLSETGASERALAALGVDSLYKNSSTVSSLAKSTARSSVDIRI